MRWDHRDDGLAMSPNDVTHSLSVDRDQIDIYGRNSVERTLQGKKGHRLYHTDCRGISL